MIRHPFALPPAEGQAVEVAQGVWWFRLPLPMALDHVNCYALDDTLSGSDGWTLIDTGFDSKRSRAIWEALLAGPLAHRPVKRVLVTHYHPDHIGLAGWFQAQGAELVTTRTSWLYARMLSLDEQAMSSPEAQLFELRAGVPADIRAVRAQQRPFNFCDVVAPLPLGFTRLVEGDVFHSAGRRWRVRLGQGHAPDHITLWSEDDPLVVGGDQLLPGISANIGVYPSEPEADPLGEWLDSTRGFAVHAREDQVILPGHKLPFTGLPLRLVEIVENHDVALGRLIDHLATPRRAADCFVPLFKREVGGAEYGMAMVEAVAHLNYLHRRVAVARAPDFEGAWVWQRV